MRHSARKTRSHMGLAVVSAIAVGTAVGMAVKLFFHEGRAAPWTVTITIPAGARLYMHALDVAATLIASGFAVLTLFAWAAVHTASGQRQWRRHGGVLVEASAEPGLRERHTAAIVINRDRLDRHQELLDRHQALLDRNEVLLGEMRERLDGKDRRDAAISRALTSVHAAAGLPVPPEIARSRHLHVVPDGTGPIPKTG